MVQFGKFYQSGTKGVVEFSIIRMDSVQGANFGLIQVVALKLSHENQKKLP
jgi:hypothetical protein